jgi:hypothetical protein
VLPSQYILTYVDYVDYECMTGCGSKIPVQNVYVEFKIN